LAHGGRDDVGRAHVISAIFGGSGSTARRRPETSSKATTSARIRAGRSLWEMRSRHRHQQQRVGQFDRRDRRRRRQTSSPTTWAGVSVQSGTGDSIVSNEIFSNGHRGIDLVAPGDPPSGVTPNQPGVRVGPTTFRIRRDDGRRRGHQRLGTGHFKQLPNTPFLIQFSVVPR